MAAQCRHCLRCQVDRNALGGWIEPTQTHAARIDIEPEHSILVTGHAISWSRLAVAPIDLEPLDLAAHGVNAANRYALVGRADRVPDVSAFIEPGVPNALV